MNVDLFVPCFVDQLKPEIAWSTIKLLDRVGCRVKYNQEQTCCGQPAWNSGYKETTRPVAQKWLNDFDTPNYIVTPSGSCAGMVKNYYMELFGNTSRHLKCKSAQTRIFELTSFLVHIIKRTDFGASLSGKAVYHDACAALRECGIKQEPRELLKNVKGLELIESSDAETCCGFGGTFAVKFESISSAMAEQKVNNALVLQADYIISTDYSCLLHIQAYIDFHKLPLKSMHIADVLCTGW